MNCLNVTQGVQRKSFVTIQILLTIHSHSKFMAETVVNLKFKTFNAINTSYNVPQKQSIIPPKSDCATRQLFW